MKNTTNELKQYIPAEGGQIFVIVRGVSRSGMSRTMSFFVIDADTRPLPSMIDITRKIADLLDLRCKDGALTGRLASLSCAVAA